MERNTTGRPGYCSLQGFSSISLIMSWRLVVVSALLNTQYVDPGVTTGRVVSSPLCSSLCAGEFQCPACCLDSLHSTGVSGSDQLSLDQHTKTNHTFKLNCSAVSSSFIKHTDNITLEPNITELTTWVHFIISPKYYDNWECSLLVFGWW